MSFDHLKTIYRDYDIRGKYPEEINEKEVKKIAKALTKHFDVKKVAVGYDVRPSAESLFDAIASGFNESGVDVVNIGLCTTPMSYHMCGSSDVDMTVMITASHMPSDYNGLKITIEDSKPVTSDVLKTIRDIVGNHTFSEEVQHGNVINHSMQEDWIKKFKVKHDLTNSNISIVIDPANLIGILEIDTFKAFEPDIKVHTIFDDFDHTAPNHEANPIKHETLVHLGREVVDKKAHLGVAFDGDADRLGFVDETGTPIASDIIGALLARYILGKNEGGVVVCDIRSSKAVVEEIERLGGRAVREKVGHTNIRGRMREEDAVLGIELSGHFFFKESYFSEGGPLAAFIIMELINREKKTLSQLVAEVKNYYHSGEINSTVTREAADIYKDLEEYFEDMKVNKLDGLTLEADDWWCNVRPSANDPVMRLNLEANTEELMKEMRDKALEIIRAS
ncbi:MAG: phosphomannomutase/phosphoglucomutase [Candidatus Nomurabacteria bacterium]|nr:MAG: phosphomannomutase/phosphoglucomutase [Candidatus Nomurabacteria bacterium]